MFSNYKTKYSTVQNYRIDYMVDVRKEEENRVPFLITKSFEGNEKYEGFVEGEREDCRVELSPEEAKKVLYWDFYKNKDGSRQWTGLFRYFDNNLTLKLLNHMLSVVNDSNKKAKITNIIKEFSKVL